MSSEESLKRFLQPPLKSRCSGNRRPRLARPLTTQRSHKREPQRQHLRSAKQTLACSQRNNKVVVRITDALATNKSAPGCCCTTTLQRCYTLTGLFIVVVFLAVKMRCFVVVVFTTALAMLDGSSETDHKAADTKTCELNKELKCAQTDER